MMTFGIPRLNAWIHQSTELVKYSLRVAHVTEHPTQAECKYLLDHATLIQAAGDLLKIDFRFDVVSERHNELIVYVSLHKCIACEKVVSDAL